LSYNFLLPVRIHAIYGTNEQTIPDVTEKEQLHILEAWLGEHKGLLFKVVRAYTGTMMDQDDLFQEIIIQVWHSIPAFREECSVTTWLYRISLNTAIKWTSKERRHSRAETLEGVQHVLQENKVAVDERLEWLYQEIHQLDEIDRSITLLLLEGFSYKEMAAILGITESNVGVKINRIKKQLISKSKNKYCHGI
jgi:RNA polymerase sigma-70 factor (ECF subfamily)